MARKSDSPPESYNVVRAQDGALVVSGVGLDVARDEKARLNAEARVIVGQQPTGEVQRTGMYFGVPVSYEIRSESGLVI